MAIGIGIAIAIFGKDRDRDLNVGDRAHALIYSNLIIAGRHIVSIHVDDCAPSSGPRNSPMFS